MERDDEVKGSGNSLDYGARIYDSRLGRWLSVDALASAYPSYSPYSFAVNTPIQAKDPDGNIVIFINGQHGKGDVKEKYWEGWSDRAMDRIGDHKSKFYDGAIGGWDNTISWAKSGFNAGGIAGASAFVQKFSNVNPEVRKESGYMQGVKDAADIIANLSRSESDPNTIVESVKIVTHSMGTAFARGFTEALQEYVDNYNSENPDNQLKGFEIEFEIDIASFDAEVLPAQKEVRSNYHMNGYNDIVAGYKGIEGSKELNSGERGKRNRGHSLYDYNPDVLPKSEKNGE